MSRRPESLNARVQRAAARSAWFFELAPRLVEMPAPIQKHDDPFLPYSRTVIASTVDVAAGYVFDVAAYLALGAAGAVALERAVAVATTSDRLAVLHGPFARPEYATFASDRALGVDAATVTDETLSAAFGAQGVAVLSPGSAGDYRFNYAAGMLVINGIEFRLAKSDFISRFQREDFADALRAAAAELTA